MSLPAGCQSLHERFAAHGFHHEHTGGNCTAFVCYTPHAEFFVTRYFETGPESIAPDAARQRVCVGRVPIRPDPDWTPGAPVAEDWTTLWTGRAYELLAQLQAAPCDWLGLGDRRGPEYAPTAVRAPHAPVPTPTLVVAKRFGALGYDAQVLPHTSGGHVWLRQTATHAFVVRPHRGASHLPLDPHDTVTVVVYRVGQIGAAPLYDFEIGLAAYLDLIESH